MTARRFLVIAVLAAVFAWPHAPKAQGGKPAQAGKVSRIGYLTILSDASTPDSLRAFRQGLRDAALVEGRDIVIEYRSAEGKPEKLGELAADLVRVGVDVIVAQVPGAVLAAKQATRTIPIVMVHGPDPIQLGLVGSLARPGGNITGLTTLSADLSGKQFELLKALVPRVSRVAILSNPTNPWHPLALREIEARAKSLDVHIQIVNVSVVEDLAAGFTAIAKDRATAVLVLADPMMVFASARIADLALKQRLPTMCSTLQTAEAGCLGSYWPNSAEQNRGAARYVQRILAGARPGDLPIEQPTKYDFVINMKTARALGLTIPPSLLLRADQVIE